MTLYEQWRQMAELAGNSPDGGHGYWSEYFEAEKENYKKILADHETVKRGTLAELAESFSMTPQVFAGFMDCLLYTSGNQLLSFIQRIAKRFCLIHGQNRGEFFVGKFLRKVYACLLYTSRCV